jgi:predicted metal-dependent HD superfamily phosphohydrolase
MNHGGNRAMDEKLKGRWLALAGELGLSGPVREAGEDLLGRYAQPHRRYHNLGHLHDCLEWLDRVRPQAGDPAAVEAALWFHDTVYDVGAADNEARSAAMAREVLCSLGLASERIETIAQEILATAHQTPPQTADAQLVCDIDLSILAAPAPKYDAYAAAIRAEAGLAPAEFRQRRSEFLRARLQRPQLYHTAAFQLQCEAPARANMQRELAELAQQAEGQAEQP